MKASVTIEVAGFPFRVSGTYVPYSKARITDVEGSYPAEGGNFIDGKIEYEGIDVTNLLEHAFLVGSIDEIWDAAAREVEAYK